MLWCSIFLQRYTTFSFVVHQAQSVRFSPRFLKCPQQFVRDHVLHVDDDGDEEATAAKRDLQGCPVHEVVDRALNKALTDAERDSVFQAPAEEDDEVGPLSSCLYPVVSSVVAVLDLPRLGTAIQLDFHAFQEAAGRGEHVPRLSVSEHTMCYDVNGCRGMWQSVLEYGSQAQGVSVYWAVVAHCSYEKCYSRPELSFFIP